jgi:adenylate kinase
MIEVSDEEVVRRLGGRRTCTEKGHVFHLEFNPPEKEGVCDIDGSELITRDDDKPEVIKKRLDTYHDKTEPLVEFYDKRGILQHVKGDAPPDEVADRIRGMLATLRREEEMEI